MRSIADELYYEQDVLGRIQNFFKRFKVGESLKKANAYKSKGISPLSIISYLVNLVFQQKSMYQDSKEKGSLVGHSVDAVYRLMRSSHINWGTFVFTIAFRVTDWLDGKIQKERQRVMILDDTLFERPYSNKTELAATVYDHVERNGKKASYKKGFLSLFLGWTDGYTFIPLSFRHMSSQKEALRYEPKDKKSDRRTNAGKAKMEAISSKPDVSLRMLREAKQYGIPAEHIVFDSWFTNPTFVMQILEIGYHAIGRMKNDSTRYYLDGQWMDLKSIYRKRCKKQRPRKNYLFSVKVLMKNRDQKTCEARIVFVRNKGKYCGWIAFLCTDLSLTEKQIIALYGKRWKIEEFFKVCKSYLRFTGEFRQTSYQAITAHTSIVALRYMILAVEQRQSVDPRRSLGDIFCMVCAEVRDIKYEEAIDLIYMLIWGFKSFLETELGVDEDILDKFVKVFVLTLPMEIQIKLAARVSSGRKKAS